MRIDGTIIIKDLLVLGAFLERKASHLLADFNLNQQQFVVLKEIQERAPVNQREICSELLFEKSNVSKITKKLLSEKLITHTPSRKDGRIGLLTVTKKGERVIARSMKSLDDWNKRWLRNLTANEIRHASLILNRLTAVLQDESE